MTSKDIYYVYAYLRQDGSPYYIGKGTKRRAWDKLHNVKLPKDKSKIVILESNLTDIGSLALERRMIRWYGRKDIGTGILRNLTDGGEGSSPSPITRQKISNTLRGVKKSEETKRNMSLAQLGKPATRPPGCVNSEVHRKRISIGKSGIAQPKHTCPHCNKTGGNAMLRWHFDNCKSIRE